MKNIAVILSGGSGARFGGTLPKQFTKLAGRAVIEYTIDAFERTELIDEIIIVSQPNYTELTWDYVKKNQWNKVTKIFNGGRSDLIQHIQRYKAWKAKTIIAISFSMML